jgi:hypothetical protein
LTVAPFDLIRNQNIVRGAMIQRGRISAFAKIDYGGVGHSGDLDSTPQSL